MAVSEAHKMASYKYNASRDSITIRPERSKGAAIRAAAAPIGTGKDRAAHGDGLPDLPGLGGDGLPEEQRTARPITCPGCSFQPDPAAALMTPPPCCPHPCQTYRQRQPPARQHPAASPTPEGSDSPPNGIWL